MGTSGRIIYEEDIKPYHWLQEKGTYGTTYWNPKGFDRMGVEYFKVVDQDSEEYERGLKKYKNRIYLQIFWGQFSYLLTSGC